MFSHGFTRARVLDVGCDTGRHGRYLSSLGHQTLGLDNNETSIRDAKELAAIKKLGSSSCMYVVCNATALPIATNFDVILANEMLHELPKRQSNQLLNELRELTVAGGLHAISGYIAEPGHPNEKNRRQAFQPGELRDLYEAEGWTVQDRDYIEIINPSTSFNGRTRLNSSVQMIAQKA